MLVLLSFAFLLFIAISERKSMIIAVALAYYLISAIPIYAFYSGFPNWDFFGAHLAHNNILIILAFFASKLLSARGKYAELLFAPFEAVKVNFSLSVFFSFSALIYLAELVGVLFYDKPTFIGSLVYGNMLVDRTFERVYPRPLALLYNNYYAIALIASLFYLYLYLKARMVGSRFFYLFNFAFMSIIYLSQLKKSTILVYAFCCVAVYLYLNKWRVGIRLVALLSLFSVVFFYVLQSYYGHTGSIAQSIVVRLLFESIQSTGDFYRIYSDSAPLGLNYIPSDGHGVFGFNGIALERELFYELYSNREGRYGNSPVLSFTYGILTIGHWVYPYLFGIYFLLFQISAYFNNNFRDDTRYILSVAVAVYFMPIFLSGGFKTFSLFILYPAAFLALMAAYLLLPIRYKDGAGRSVLSP